MKGLNYVVVASLLNNGSAGKEVPDTITTPAELRAWVRDNFPHYEGPLALVTVNRTFRRTRTETSDLQETDE